MEYCHRSDRNGAPKNTAPGSLRQSFGARIRPPLQRRCDPRLAVDFLHLAQLREALADEHAQTGAADIIRKLVDKVVLTPVADEEGRKSLTIDLHGHLAGILSLATKAKRPLGESGLPVEYTKLVAGIGFEPMTFRL